MNYYAVLTDHGAQLIEQAYQHGQVVTITQMAIGDGGGVELEPAPSALAVAGEFDRVPLTSGASASSMLGGGVDYESTTHVGKWIRTLGLMDAQGNLIVYSNYPPTYIADKGSTLFRTLGLNIQLPIVHGDAVTVIVERPPYPPATETEYGVVKLATQAQTDAGAADDVVVTPKKLKSWVKQATETVLGMLKVATQAQTDAGVADDVVVTPKKLKAWVKQATETVLGMLKVATQSQVDAGVADDVAVTPKKMRAGFSISLTSQPYICFPSWLGGLIIQMGDSAPSQSRTTWPIAFPTRCIAAATLAKSSATTVTYDDLQATGTSFSLQSSTTGANQPAASCKYIAVGH